MRKFFNVIKPLIFTLGVTLLFTACDMETRPVEFQELPETAQQMIKAKFPDKQVILCTKDDDILWPDYEVTFEDGTKLELNHKGELIEIDSKYN